MITKVGSYNGNSGYKLASMQCSTPAPTTTNNSMKKKDVTFERFVSTKLASKELQHTVREVRSELLAQMPVYSLKTASEQFEVCCVAAKIIIKKSNQ